MITCTVLFRRVFHGLFVLGLLLSQTLVRGQTVTNFLDRFDTNSYPANSITNEWSNWFGAAFQSLSLDVTNDANANSQSGSLKIVANFPSTTDQFEVWNGINGISPALNGLQFTNFSCDVRFAPGSATNSSGKFGNLEFGVPTPGYGQNYFGSVSVAATNSNWVHVSIALNANSNTNLKSITGLLIHIWGAGLNGPSTLWVDNLQFIGMATNVGTVTINYTDLKQRIDGFGASSAWMSGTLATNVADLLFSTNTGAGLSLLRTRIAPDGTSWENNIAQQAQARGASVWSTPWSPPIAYKDTNSVNGGHFVSATNNFQNYASLLAKYVAGVKKNYGITLAAISVQNEPNYATDYESCVWNGQQIHDFVPYLAAAMTASNVAETKIMLPEDANWKWDLATNTMNDATTSNLVGILAAHNYGSSAAPVTAFGTPCPKTLWETEHYFGNNDGITNGLELAQEVHSFLTLAQANAYHYWWLTGSGTGSIMGTNLVTPAKRLYVLGQYSKFIRPNFYRVGTSNTSVALVSAYQATNSGSFVIVAANPTAYAVNQTFVLTNFPVVNTLTQWVTSATLSLSNQGPVNITNRTFTYLLPPWTVASFNYVQPAPLFPVIAQQPTNQTGFVYGQSSFAVISTGNTPLFYQWRSNTTNDLSSETNDTLILKDLIPSDAGNYWVVISNSFGSVTSSIATLTVSTNANFVLSATDTLGNSSFNSNGSWTNSISGDVAAFAPSPGYTYATGGQTLRTPAAAGNYTFGGSALTISPGGILNIKGGNANIITFSNLLLHGTINDTINANQIAVLAGNMTIPTAGSLNTQAALNDLRGITNSMNLFGGGALTNTGLGTGPGYVVYRGDNSAFTGPLIVNSNTILQAASQTNLGGNPASFNAGQLTLNNGTFVPTTSMALNNPNSGIAIGSGGGGFNLAANVTLSVSNPISGPGNLVIWGGGKLLLATSNTATGNLIISNSILQLTGNATLNNLNLGISNNSTLDVTELNLPLTISNRLTLAGNLWLSVNSTNISSRLLTSNLIYGGTLTISNRGPSFANGNTFQLFNASNYSGAFNSIVPASPGAGLVWDISKLSVNGILQVAQPPSVTIQPAVTNITYGQQLVLTANVTGTFPMGYQWYDAQTNPIYGASFADFTNIPNVAASGKFFVVVTNAFGRATNNANLTVTRANLNVTANATNRLFGTTNPTFTANFGGFVNGDNFNTAVAGQPNFFTTAGNNSLPGNYVLTPLNGTLAAANYNFIFNPGVLTILPLNSPTNLVIGFQSSALSLDWPDSHLGWTLQFQTNTANGLTSNWVDVANSANTNHWIIIPDSQKPAMFFRLRR